MRIRNEKSPIEEKLTFYSYGCNGESSLREEERGRNVIHMEVGQPSTPAQRVQLESCQGSLA